MNPARVPGKLLLGICVLLLVSASCLGTCVGTGMGFDPAFYYYRPQSVDAAHGYGPVLLAGAEMINVIKSGNAVINDAALQFGYQPANIESAR